MVVRVALALLLAAAQLPPISWTCPMHPEILEDAAGECPICKMPLEAVRLETVFSCPIHSVVAQQHPGRCPICRRELVQATMAVSWRCDGKVTLEPGRCADGSAAVIKYTPRPHGNHNPQHGGQFFMAPDNWHHLEGAYPGAGVFRLYLYDDYSRPLPVRDLRRVSARVVTDTSLRLAPAKDGSCLEGTIARVDLPARMSARVRFKPDETEYQFDFAFTAYSTDLRAPGLTA